MTYQETLAYIYGLGRFGMRPGLEKITALLASLGNPQNRIKSIHVAGTNGKGSTAAFLSSILQHAGYKVGLFTSPHLIRFTERIRINNAEISSEDVTRLAQLAIDASSPETTFFELVTAMTWLHFAAEEVDLAIMETGMGGRFDATNSASGILSVITPISLDHCQYLGNSLAEIAFEKAGIIEPGYPVVTSNQTPEALDVIAGQCSRLSSPLYRCGKEFSANWETGGLSYSGIHVKMRNLTPGMAGRYQASNAATALASAELLQEMGFALPESAMRAGIEGSSWPGRMEMVGEEPRILLDGAHNQAGVIALADELREIPHERLILVAGVMADKDAEEMFKPLFPMANRVYTVSPSLERAMPSDRLAEFCRSFCVDCSDAGTVEEGLYQAKEFACSADLIVVCGSLFTVGEARSVLFSERFEPFRG
jgi:dihydrofolate synthase / folylpolyglutamate synthase